MTYDDKGKYTPTVRESLDEMTRALFGIQSALEHIAATLDDIHYEQSYPGSEENAARRNRAIIALANKANKMD